LKVTVLRVRRHSEDIPAGTIVSTEPASGSKVRRGATVDLRLSSGPERFQVPAGLVGASKAAAIKALRPLPLSTSYSVAYNESVPVDHVVSIDPPAGSSLKRGQLVTVVLSQGPKPFPVPSVVGRSQGDAEAVLAQAGLKSQASEDFSDSVPAGSVISQQPDSGEVHRGDTVQLVVSKGPQLVAVPDVMHKPLGDARDELLAAGLQPQVHRIFGAGLGLVVQVEPGAGTMVPRGSQVQLTVV
ncbi:MAG TPA: PASTA domain-containing protein, partial [Mycobacteriales bacterium]|nr:PASTA domain-containing protein [Mycobacteriales bacterium]